MAVVSGIPLSFFWNKINYAKILGENNFGKAVDELALGTFREFEAIPLIKDPFTENMLTFVNTHLEPGDGLLIDFFGWDKTYYIALRASNRSLIVSGAKHGDVETGLLENYLNNHSTGFIIFSRLGKLHETALFYDSLLEFKNVKTPLVINEVFAVRGKKIFSYRTVLPEYAEKIKQQNGQLTTIFSTERDIEFFEETIISDASWYAGIQRTAFWKREPLDSVLRKNAEYMIFTERKE